MHSRPGWTRGPAGNDRPRQDRRRRRALTGRHHRRALTRAAAEAQIPAWTEREYGHLTDETLADELARARQRLDAAVAGRAAAVEEARLLAEAAAAGRGPAVTRLEQEIAELDRTAEELARHSALEATWQTAIQSAQAAAAAASLAEHDRDQLNTRARRRRAEIDTRITELHQNKRDLSEAATTAADLAKALTRVPHDRAERERLAERIATADTRHQQLRQKAEAKDIESARNATLRAAAHQTRALSTDWTPRFKPAPDSVRQRRQQEGRARDAEVASSPRLRPRRSVTYIDPSPPAPSVQPSL